MTMQKTSRTLPLPSSLVMRYLLGAGGSESGGDGHAAGGFDEPRPALLSMGPLLKMDSNMQHDDDSDTEMLLADGSQT